MIVRRLLLLATLVAGLGALAPAASGQEAGFLQVDDILPGHCNPDPILVAQQTDCSFPLARQVELDPDGGPYVADVGSPYDEDNEERASCDIEDGQLVCRGVPTYYPAGTEQVRVQVGWVGTTGVLAEIKTLDYWQVDATISSFDGQEPYTTPHRPFEVWIDSPQHPLLLAKVFDRFSGAEVTTVPVPPFESFEPVDLGVGDLPPGRYWVQPCLPAADETAPCELVSGAQFFQVGTGELVEAVPGHNRLTGDRVNLILAGTGFDDFAHFREIAVEMLGFDGPTLVDFEGKVVEPGPSVEYVEFGPFATEPLRSLKERFNVWLMIDPLHDGRNALFYTEPPNGLGFAPGGEVLPDAQITALELLPIGEWSRSWAGWPSFTSVEPGAPDRTDLQFAGAYVALPRWNPLIETDTLTHELGHAVFDLRDEYTLSDRSTELGYPNCAPDLETAEAWWDDRVGEVDPFLDEYFAVMQEHGRYLGDLDELRDSVTVGYHWGGCYGDVGSREAVRPTSDSIMNSQLPVFGAVNRSRVVEIATLWTGRDTLRSAADIDISCERDASDPWSVLCRGELIPFVDPPGGGINAGIGVESLGCDAVAGDGAAPVAVECRPLRTGGYGPAAVEIDWEEGTLLEVLLPEIAVAAPPVQLGLGGPPPPGPDRVLVEPGSAWMVAVPLGFGVLAIVIALGVVWRRGRSR